MSRLLPLDTGDPGDSGDTGAFQAGGAVSARGEGVSSAGWFASRTHATGRGACVGSRGELASSPASVVQVSTPLQSLNSGPWQSPGKGKALQSTHPSSSHLHSACPAVEGGNPSDLGRFEAAGRQEVRARLPHEVRDHPDADLSKRLLHLWNPSREVGVCGEIFVPNPGLQSSSLSELAPLSGANPVIKRWSTLGGDTRSFSQVLQAPSQPVRNMDRRQFPPNRFNQGFEGNRGFRPGWQG